MTLTKRHKIDLVVLTLVAIGGLVAVMHAQAVNDWVYFLRYKPSPEVVKLADDAGLSDRGRHLLYRFDPQIVSEEALSAACGSDDEQLGCTAGHKIYILKSANPGQHNRDVVTAAHEMLHVAYSRLPLPEQSKVNTMLNAQIHTGIDQGITDDLHTYGSEDFINEAHSFIATEQPKLNPSLEQYYQRYFNDRQKTITAYQNSPEAN